MIDSALVGTPGPEKEQKLEQGLAPGVVQRVEGLVEKEELWGVHK